MTTLIIETANGIKFTNRKQEFDKGGYAGYLRKTKQGILFMDADKLPQAYLTKNDGGFFVTAFKSEADGGRTRYMYGLSTKSAEFIGYGEAANGGICPQVRQAAKSIIRDHF